MNPLSVECTAYICAQSVVCVLNSYLSLLIKEVLHINKAKLIKQLNQI